MWTKQEWIDRCEELESELEEANSESSENETKITPQQRDAYLEIRCSSANDPQSLDIVSLSPSGILYLEAKVEDRVYSIAIAPDGSQSHARVI